MPASFPPYSQASVLTGSATAPTLPSLCVAIATRGRGPILTETIRDLHRQTVLPAAILVSYVNQEDVAEAARLFPEVEFLRGMEGSCAQRNLLLDHAAAAYDLILFMDDDFYLQRNYIERMTELFRTRPDVLAATGAVLRDGAKGPGLLGSDARRELDAIRTTPALSQLPAVPAYNTYGCNMLFRVAALRAHGIRFDEQLPAYGWYEDIDFSRRLLPFGAVVRVPAAQGIHLGAKVGKSSGRNLGYSQVANPIYLAQKGSYPWADALRSVARNVTANLAHCLAPEPYIDRRGRLQGNLLAAGDLLARRLHPTRILTLR